MGVLAPSPLFNCPVTALPRTMHPHATFAAQSNIHSKGFRSLQEGEVVEFDVEHGQDGRVKAVNVTGPGGGPIQVGSFLGGDDGLPP